MWGFVGHDEPFKTDPRSDCQFSSLAAIDFLQSKKISIVEMISIFQSRKSEILGTLKI